MLQIKYLHNFIVQHSAIGSALSGFAYSWIILKEKIDIDGNIINEGLRSGYHISYAPNHSWTTAVKVIYSGRNDSKVSNCE